MIHHLAILMQKAVQERRFFITQRNGAWALQVSVLGMRITLVEILEGEMKTIITQRSA